MILTGWKQIATHLGYGVRTVQRWERIGLPVKRVTKSPRSPVVADSGELDAWLLRRTAVRGNMPQRVIELHYELRRTGAEFLRTEIQTGLAMSKMALESEYHDRERNRANSRKAYDTLMHLIPKIALTTEEADKIKRGLEQLKSALRQLGEEL